MGSASLEGGKYVPISNDESKDSRWNNKGKRRKLAFKRKTERKRENERKREKKLKKERKRERKKRMKE